jgi:hypothetical protein
VVAARAFIPFPVIGADGGSGFRPIVPQTMITQPRTMVRVILTQATRMDTVTITGPATKELQGARGLIPRARRPDWPDCYLDQRLAGSAMTGRTRVEVRRSPGLL